MVAIGISFSTVPSVCHSQYKASNSIQKGTM
jgi:hypothetical protein